MTASPALRPQVLALYKRILTCAKTWQAKNPIHTEEERMYIRDEARRLFSANRNLADENKIRLCIQEARHYQMPYPRPVHFPPKSITRTQQRLWGSANLRRQSRSRPIYIKTLDQDSGAKSS
ncbi:LYR motif-containing protein 1 isoform X2 [Hyalella azteca]|uniref:LYR motif-containing protein 1 isoform X2 n=1 Tax=Hyalella azteca TaxID=294128 RepID=A0A8B7NI34_HYAAZ|nr:LYR motif-containing protein 1 isoform X2 [Hyalella azteca]